MKNYDKRVKQTRVFLDDYLVIKGLSRQAGISMAEALHKIITRDWAMGRSVKPVISVRVPVPVTGRIFPSPVAKATLGSTNARLRVTVAGRGSSNGL
ncbi:hypothetical protein ES708_30472 [subsurface metagenome]